MTSASKRQGKGGISSGEKGAGWKSVPQWEFESEANVDKGRGKSKSKSKSKDSQPTMTWSGRLAKNGAPREPMQSARNGAQASPNDDHRETAEESSSLSGIINGAKTVQQIEAEMLIAKLSSKGDSLADKAAKTPLEAKGSHCEVKKHSDIGCSVVTMESESAREVVLRLALSRTAHVEDATTAPGKERRPEIIINGHKAQLRAHLDKSSKSEVKTDIFVAWGRKAEKESPLPPVAIAAAIDDLFREARKELAATMQNAVVLPTHVSNELPSTMQPATSPGQMMQPQMGLPHMPPAQAQQQQAMFSMMGMQAAAAAAAAQAAAAQQQSMLPQHQATAMTAQASQQAAYMAAAQQHQQQQQQQQQQIMMQQAHMYAITQLQQQQQLQQQHWQQQQQQLLQQQQQQLQQQPAPAAEPGPGPSTPRQEGTDVPKETHKLSADAPVFNASQTVTEDGISQPGVYARESNPWRIVNPASGESINPTGVESTPPERPGRHKPLKIVNPNSGNTIDPVGLNFTPPKASRPFSIIDPSSGDMIKV